MNQGLTFEREALDTLKIARKLLPDLPSRRLPDLCAYYQVDPGNSHRALDDALSTHFLLWHMWEAFKETAPEEFTLYPLVYSAKKQSPIAKSQKAYLNDLLKYHRIETDAVPEKWKDPGERAKGKREEDMMNFYDHKNRRKIAAVIIAIVIIAMILPLFTYAM